MYFDLTEEQQLFRDLTREWAQKHLAPRAEEIDRTEKIPADVLKAMADQGLFGITISEEYGGQGADWTTASLVGEEIARADISVATAVLYLVEASWAQLIDKYGNEQLKQEVLPKVCSGEHICGVATTEPVGGTDVAGNQFTIRKDGDEWVVNGEKAYISGTEEAAEMGGGHITTGVFDRSLHHRGLNLFYLPADTWESRSKFEDMGRMGISTGAFVCNEARIPSHYIIGEEGKGFYYALEGYNNARIIIGATCVGAAATALEMGVDYIKERRAFGKRLSQMQGLQWQVADQYAKLEASRLTAYKAAWIWDQYESGKSNYTIEDVNLAVAHSKLRCPTAAFDIIAQVMDWYGAYGYTKECPLERGLRGVKSYVVGAEGAKNIMKQIIARDLIGREFVSF